jgi:hypothetical protein
MSKILACSEIYLRSAPIVRRLLFVFALACGTLALAGCGPRRPACYAVTGKVTYGGRAVEQGTITFYPEQGRSSSGRIQPDGTYRLTTFEEGDGALPGKHVVTIQATAVSGPAQPSSFEEELAQGQSGGASGGGSTGTVEWLVPEMYSRRETTTLSAVVETQANQIDFDIEQLAP